MSEVLDLELPKVRIEPSRQNAKSMVLFGLPKSGKTTAISELDNCLIIDTEDGSDFVGGLKMKVPVDLGPVSKMHWLRNVARKIKATGNPYDYVVVDTLTEVDAWAEWCGTYAYMNSTQGISFNREKDAAGNPIKGGRFLDPGSSDYESVHSLPNGFGYRYSRDEMIRTFDELQGLGKVCTIFIAHVADKSIVSKLTNQEVTTRDLSLTGKVKDIVSRRVDALGYVYNKDGKLKVSFKGDDSKIGGIRSKHLVNYDDVVDWSKIFIK